MPSESVTPTDSRTRTNTPHIYNRIRTDRRRINHKCQEGKAATEEGSNGVDLQAGGPVREREG